MKGQIYVQSVEGMFSKFTIIIPDNKYTKSAYPIYSPTHPL